MFTLCENCTCLLKDINEDKRSKYKEHCNSKYKEHCNNFYFENNETVEIKISPLEQDMIDKYGAYWLNADKTL